MMLVFVLAKSMSVEVESDTLVCFIILKWTSILVFLAYHCCFLFYVPGQWIHSSL